MWTGNFARVSRRRPSWRHIGVGMVLVGIVLVYRSFLEEGHDWGDDFSLYINQARALVRGDVGQVVSDTRYILQNSGTDSFSPYVYPWGLPILLAPVYLVAGINYRAFAWVTVISLVVFLWLFRRLVAPVIGSLGATSITAVIALSTPYVWWSGSVTSDFPAIASVMVALWWIDRCRRLGHFAASTRTPLVVVGLLATWAFAIRREVVVVLFAAAAVQALELHRARRRAPGTDTQVSGVSPSGEGRRSRWLDVAAPYWTFALSTGTFHLVLPASLEQQVDGGGVGEIWGNLTWYRDILAEHVGLKEIGPNEIEVFGSHRLGLWLIGVLALSGALGLVVAMLRRRESEFALAVYAICVSWVILTRPFHEGRYIFALSPMLLFFSWIAVSWLVSPGRGTRAAGGARHRRAAPARRTAHRAERRRIPSLVVLPPRIRLHRPWPGEPHGPGDVRHGGALHTGRRRGAVRPGARDESLHQPPRDPDRGREPRSPTCRLDGALERRRGLLRTQGERVEPHGVRAREGVVERRIHAVPGRGGPPRSRRGVPPAVTGFRR